MFRFPILCAFEDAALKQKIPELLKKDETTEAELNEMLELVYKNPEVRKTMKYMHLSAKAATENLQYAKESQNIFTQLI